MIKNAKNERGTATKKKIESFIFWAGTLLWSLLFLVLIAVYFKSGVTRSEILATIKYQFVCLVVAIFNCPLVPAPFWVRVVAFGGGIFILETGI
jgi:hypothetical protein